MSPQKSNSKLNYFFILKERNALLWLILLIFFVVLVVFLDSLKPSNFRVAYLGDEDLNTKMKGLSTSSVSQINESDRPSVWKSFGDNFSSPVYLDKGRSDMYLDDMTTSLVFPPLYSWNKTEDCLESGCDLTSSSRAGKFLLEKNEINYLADLRIMPQPLPAEIRNKNIVAASLHTLGPRQIAGFVVKEREEERGFVYFLDDKKYLLLISDQTEVEILTKYGKGNGYIAFGGDVNNFLIFYVGYEIHAFHYNNGELLDISRFFGLRVASSGFYPYIIKQGEGRESVWYILSLEKTNQKLIKLWQNDTNQIKGSLDLSGPLNRSLETVNGGPMFIRPGLVKGELDFIIKNEESISLNEQGLGLNEEGSSLYVFKDDGFDNSKSRQAVSINLNKKYLPLARAQIRSFGVSINDDDGGEYVENFPHPKFTIYLGDSLDNFLATELGKTIKFNGEKGGLYWKIEFVKGNKNEYSPWFDHLNDLQYLVYL